MSDFLNTLNYWYARNKRDLPWRQSNDAYVIWLSEIILQQTRVIQGMGYFYRFIERFPSITDLANATEDEVLKLWQGLGYYSRARNLHAAARSIQQNYKGIFPSEYALIIGLKGVGEYTASAIASMAFGLPYAVVDGNVYRLLSRYLGIMEPIDSSSGKKLFGKVAQDLLDIHNPGLHNQAMMEFGALQCVPVNPDCLSCPLNHACWAYENKKVSSLPIKEKKVKTRNRYFYYLVIHSSHYCFLQKRTQKDIWRNLYEFPLLERTRKESIDTILTDDLSRYLLDATSMELGAVSDWKTHVLSHQKLYCRFIELYVEDEKKIAPNLIRVNKKDIFDFAVPKLIENYISSCRLF